MTELTPDEVALLRDALTIPMCWAPWRREEALAVLDRAADQQQTLFEVSARGESEEVIQEYDGAEQSSGPGAVVPTQTIDGLSEGGAVLAPSSPFADDAIARANREFWAMRGDGSVWKLAPQ